MKATISLLMLVCLCSLTACAQDMSGNHNHSNAPASSSPDTNVSQDWAKQRLAKSRREIENGSIRRHRILDGLRKLQRHQRSAGELDAVVHPAAECEAGKPGEDERGREAGSPSPPLDEIEIRVV